MRLGGGARSIAHPKCLPESRTAGPSLNIWSPSHSCYPSPPLFWDCPKPCPVLAPPSPISGKFRFQESPAGETEMCMGKCHEEKHILPSAPKPAQTLEQFRWPVRPPTAQGQGRASLERSLGCRSEAQLLRPERGLATFVCLVSNSPSSPSPHSH